MTRFRLRRLKRRLVRQAVAENLEVMQGPELWRARRRRQTVRTVLRSVVMLVVPTVLLASSLALTRSGSAGPTDVRYRTPGTTVPAVTPEGPSAAARLLPAPQRIDPEAFPLPIRTVVLDPGHGGENTGTMAPGGLVEKDLTLDIADRVRELLRQASFRVVMTRQEDESVSLEERAERANAVGGDLFVSIHLNWIADRKARGVETYFLGPTGDPYLTELAARENVDSGYSRADLRSMLESIYADVRTDESRRLARAVQGELLRSLRARSPAIQDRGVKSAPFIVLIATDMPAILAEVSCLSNAAEAELLQQADYRDDIAYSLFSGILSYAESVYRTT